MPLDEKQVKKINRAGTFSKNPDLAKLSVFEDMADSLEKLAGAETVRIEGKRGPKGEKGDKGETGEKGKDGKDGKDGVNGKDGINGKDGLNGKDGVDGLNGINGTNGKDGEMGTIDDATIGYLQNEIKKLEERVNSVAARPTSQGGFRANNATKFYPLTADGSTLIFTVPKSVASIVLMSDFPHILFEGAANGFTINASRTQITLTVENAPSLGSQLLYQYSSQFN